MTTDQRKAREMALVYMTETAQGKVALRRLFGAALGMSEKGHPPFTRYPEMIRVILEKEFCTHSSLRDEFPPATPPTGEGK